MFPWPRNNKAIGVSAEYTNEAQEIDVCNLFLIPLPEESYVVFMCKVDNLCAASREYG